MLDQPLLRSNDTVKQETVMIQTTLQSTEPELEHKCLVNCVASLTPSSPLLGRINLNFTSCGRSCRAWA